MGIINEVVDVAKKTDGIVEGAVNSLDGVRVMNKSYAGKVFYLSGDLVNKYPNGVKFTS